jgi:glycosyltransferase involved in cell wall biosynthesis
MAIPTLDEYRKRGADHQRQSGGIGISDTTHDAQSRVSIVTVVRNAESTLERTVKSVLSQTHRNIEYIVIDAASTDGTLDIIRRYEDRIAAWISEPDKGIYDAMNKGVSMASGSAIGILNAGDAYLPDTVAQAFGQLVPSAPMLVYGKTRIVNSSGEQIGAIGRRFDPAKVFGSVGFMHPSLFATQLAYARNGLFDLRLRCGADSDWILRAYRRGIDFKMAEHECVMANDGVSNNALKFIGYGEYLQSLVNNGFPIRDVYKSMAWIGARSLINIALGKSGL